MQRNGILVWQKYREYLGSTMGFIVSLYLAAIVDGILVSQLLGPAAFAAINLTMPVYYARNIIFFLFVDGGATLAAQFIGSRNWAACDKVFTLSIGWGTIALLLLGLGGSILAEPLAHWLAGDSSLSGMVQAYLVPLWLTGPLLILTNGVAAYLRLEGEHKLAIAIPVVANLCNLIFDYIFMAVLDWGIVGAGWATGAGYACSLLLLLPYRQRSERAWHFVSLTAADKLLLRQLMAVGLPMSIIPLGLVVRYFAINSMAVDYMGDMGALTVSLCNAALLYALMFADGSSTALSNVCGALYGEMDKEGTIQVLRRALHLTFGLCLLAFTLIVCFPAEFMGFYGVAAERITPELILDLRISLLYMLVLAHVFILRAFYQATRQERAATVFSLLEGVVLVVLLFYGMSRFSYTLMWSAPALAALLSLGWLIIHMRRKAREQGIDSFLMLQADTDVWEISIPATVEAATQAAQAAEDFCGRHAGLLDSRQAYAAQLTIEELCVNIANYDNRGENGHIDVFLRLQEQAILVKVRDAGKPFNPVKFLDEHGEEFSGLLMVQKLTSKIEYVRILGFNTTIVTIGKRRG